MTVAVTGPTGEIGQAVVAALERSREVGEILGMARRPFDPGEKGWKKVVYRRGDVLDRRKVTRLVEEADVVIHLAFMIMGSAKASRRVNLDGSRNVFEAAAAAGVKRLIYASSVAAYGFHKDNPQPLTEDVPARGTAAHYYSAQKAEVGVAAGGRPLRLAHEGVRVPPVHRRRAARAAADRQPARTRRSPSGCRAPC